MSCFSLAPWMNCQAHVSNNIIHLWLLWFFCCRCFNFLDIDNDKPIYFKTCKNREQRFCLFARQDLTRDHRADTLKLENKISDGQTNFLRVKMFLNYINEITIKLTLVVVVIMDDIIVYWCFTAQDDKEPNIF